MPAILYTAEAGVMVTVPYQKFMRALTQGGFGRLPGDAVTDDILDEAIRLEVASSMPVDRAIDNMLREGFDGDFATRWVRAQIEGGETDATALGMIRDRDCRDGSGHEAIDPAILPDRTFRDAWVQSGAGVVVDLAKAKTIFAQRVVRSKLKASAALASEIEVAQLAGADSAALEASYQAMIAMDLRKLGVSVMSAKSPAELQALWPADLRPL